MRVLRKHADVVSKCFEDSPTRFALALYSRDLISSDTRDRVVETPGLAPADKAAILFTGVERVIGTCSGIDRTMLFQEFCRVVKDHPVAGRHMKSMFAD